LILAYLLTTIPLIGVKVKHDGKFDMDKIEEIWRYVVHHNDGGSPIVSPGDGVRRRYICAMVGLDI
jgi:hypothetical protein